MISQVDLKKEYNFFKKDITKAINQVSQSGWYLLGEKLQSFEKSFARYTKTKYAIGVASGHDAIKLSLYALNLKPSTQVILAANTYPTAMAVADAGFTIKLVDVNSNLQLNLKKLKKAINSKTRVIIATHLYGIPEKIIKIRQLARKHKIHLIEDCAQAHGATVKNKSVGSFGHLGCFSFYPTKNLGCLGDGGIITTTNGRLAKKIIQLRQYGETKRYYSHQISGHSRLSEIQAAVLSIKLKKLNQLNIRRRQLAKIYLKKLPQSLLLPEFNISSSVFHQFVITAPKRNKLQQYLAKHKIQTAIHYPLPVHKVPALQSNFKNKTFPHAEAYSAKILSLPIHPFLTESQVRFVASKITKFYAKK